MTDSQKKLFDKYIEASEAFYNGMTIRISDEDYDKLERKVHEFLPEFNVKTYITFHQQGLTLKHHCNFIPYTKSTDEKLNYEKLKEFGSYLSPKYDGSSIVAYFRDGKCYQIISRSDDKKGKNQYDKLKNKVNEIFKDIDHSITEVFMEAVTNLKYGDRSKANGLINSKYMQKEVDEKLQLMPCECNSPDPNVRKEFQDKYVHQVSKSEMDYIIENGKLEDGTPVDGIVAYNPDENKLKMRKIYCNGSSDSIVIGHEISFSTKTLTQSVVIKFNPVKVDGATLSNANMGPIATVRKSGLGIGARVRIIRTKKVIPFIDHIYEKSENFSDIKCNYCHSNMKKIGTDEICMNPDCARMNNAILRRLYSTIFDESPEVLLGNLGFKGPTLIDGTFKYIQDENLNTEFSKRIRNLDANGIFKLFRFPRYDFKDKKNKIKDFDKMNEEIKSCEFLNQKLKIFQKSGKLSKLQIDLSNLTMQWYAIVLNKLRLEY